ncbi:MULTISPECIES: hypothetical protein [unclassified Photorhabdus]|uniref:hypothetical protein n=1 Tax=unclassified Photorhabdus TaxID=2620880 RepID=UPI000B254AFD|nr:MULTISPECIES: hypothetical protein [unclassified Photorhabdus]NDK94332.1 hypothetical protein [Photorhabdus laumondii subsp. laumondii]
MTGVSECSQQRSNLKDDGYSTHCLIDIVLFNTDVIIRCRYFASDHPIFRTEY